jgi:hypothetical protein
VLAQKTESLSEVTASSDSVSEKTEDSFKFGNNQEDYQFIRTIGPVISCKIYRIPKKLLIIDSESKNQSFYRLQKKLPVSK